MLDYEKIGKNIRGFRKQLGLSQEQLAEKIWISTTHMSHIETGSTKLSLPVLVDIANVLGVSTDILLSVKPTKEKQERIDTVDEILKNCSANDAKILVEVLKSTKLALEKYK